MKEIDIQDSSLFEEAMQAFEENPVILIQFPDVCGLMALPNQIGVNGLNQTKNRLSGKYYGSVIGSAEKFFGMQEDFERLPYLKGADDYKLLEGSILRLRISGPELNSAAVFEGTHQSLLFKEGPIRSLFRKLERAFEPIADASVFGGKSFSAPLCTSANISGHENGSIVDLEIARVFGKQKGIPLLIRSESLPVPGGSFPVLYLQNKGISVQRKGPGLEEIKARFPSEVFLH
jgi:tRNA A37 threonylcarbamoyladenosine synthetase subunit TsaC/SUA5/YrdC